MVMPLGTIKWECSDCKWTQVVNQKGDVLIKPSCPKCGSEKIEMIKPNVVDQLTSLVSSLK